MTDISRIAAMAGLDPEKVRAVYDALRGEHIEAHHRLDDEIAYAACVFVGTEALLVGNVECPVGISVNLDASTAESVPAMVKFSVDGREFSADLRPYGYRYWTDDFYADVRGVLRRVPEKLARACLTLLATLVASALRTGTSVVDWTETPFFGIDKPTEPGSAARFSNLHRARPMSADSLRVVWEAMRSVPAQWLGGPIVGDTVVVATEDAAAEARTAAAEFAGGLAIKHVVVLPQLMLGGCPEDAYTWYMTVGGAPSILYAEDPVDLLSEIGPPPGRTSKTDAAASRAARSAGLEPPAPPHRCSWSVTKRAAVSLGLPTLIHRAEAR